MSESLRNFERPTTPLEYPFKDDEFVVGNERFLCKFEILPDGRALTWYIEMDKPQEGSTAFRINVSTRAKVKNLIRCETEYAHDDGWKRVLAAMPLDYCVQVRTEFDG